MNMNEDNRKMNWMILAVEDASKQNFLGGF